MSKKPLFRKIPQSKLGVSEPNPSWFGNPENDKKNSHWTNGNWLKSRFHFSFAEYSNPRNTNFGVLRVLNDDLVQPNRGFGPHPHRDVEICTYVVEGKLSHKDSMGTEESLSRGAIQFMTAGRGVTHSEHNLDAKDPLRFIQIWINTRHRGLKPNYGSFIGDFAARDHQWSHLVSDVQSDEKTPIKINQDANIFVAELQADNNQAIHFEIKEGRQAYLLNIEGSSLVETIRNDDKSEELLERHDAAEVYGPSTLTIQTTGKGEGAHVLLVEMEYAGLGRTDL